MSVTFDLLERNRDGFNARVAAARRGGAAIDGDAFLAHLRDVVTPIVERVSALRTESAGPALEALFDISLQLFTANQLGPTAKSDAATQLWNELLPAAPALVARDPRRFVGALSNAAINVGSSAHARFDQWKLILRELLDATDELSVFLAAAQVAAWRAGMAEYRAGALAALTKLPLAAAAVALGVPSIDSAEAFEQLVTALTADRSLAPAEALTGGPRVPAIIGSVGAFSGFGGDFLRPPTVWPEGDELYVSDGVAVWRILADRFGSALIRHPAPPLKGDTLRRSFVSQAGHVTLDGASAQLGALTGSTSSALAGHMMAVTLATSHHVYLIARSAEVPS